MSVAIEETLQERGSTHGDYAKQSKMHDDLLKTMMASDQFLKLNAPQRQALNIIAMKISRILNGDANHKDHWHDIAGYAKLAEDNCTDETTGKLAL